MSAPPAKATDTICVSIPTYQSLVTKAKQKTILEDRVLNLSFRIDTLQSIIHDQKQKDSVTVSTYEKQVFGMSQQILLYKADIKIESTLLKREKRKRFLTAIGGTLTTAAAIFLFINK